MRFIFGLRRRLGWANLPAGFLVMLLQRSPALRLAALAEDRLAISPVGSLLRSTAALAGSLGALHTLAGATTIAISGSNPLSATAGVAITGVAFAVNGTQNPPSSWSVDLVPPGLNFSGLTTFGAVNVTTVDGHALLSGTPSTAGTYTMHVVAWESPNGQGLSTSTYTFTLNVSSNPNAPSFTTQPQSQSVLAGKSVTFTASATGSPTYQWQLNGAAIAGATASSYTIASAQPSNAGSYTVVATNSGVSVSSASATLTVTSTAPYFTTLPPSTIAVATQTTVVLTVVAGGTPAPTLQWQFNGANLTGATDATLMVTGATAANAGSYTCLASNAGGSVTSAASVLSIASTSNPGRLVNLSVLSPLTPGQTLTEGFVVGGSGTSGNQALLIRGMGPTLQALGVSGSMADPQIALHQTVNGQDTVQASNAGWGTPSSNLTAVNAADAATGAFAPSSGATHDSALVKALSPSPYTSIVNSSSGGSGTVLAEVYDDTAAGSYTLASPRLINLSCNFQIAPGSTLTTGFVVGGSTAKTVLIRAMGPTLAAAPFNLSGTMPDPQLSLHTTISGQDTILASDTGWGGSPEIKTAAANVQAFSFASSSSKDSALLVTLSPGDYTAQASSLSGASGVIVLEVYEVP